MKAEKSFNTKENFQWFYIPVMLFDSVYRKGGSYYLTVFLEKFTDNLFWRSITNFGFGGFGSSLWNIRRFLDLEQESAIWIIFYLIDVL